MIRKLCHGKGSDSLSSICLCSPWLTKWARCPFASGAHPCTCVCKLRLTSQARSAHNAPDIIPWLPPRAGCGLFTRANGMVGPDWPVRTFSSCCSRNRSILCWCKLLQITEFTELFCLTSKWNLFVMNHLVSWASLKFVVFILVDLRFLGTRGENGVPDLTLISNIDEVGINRNLQVRYDKQQIYVSFTLSKIFKLFWLTRTLSDIRGKHFDSSQSVWRVGHLREWVDANVYRKAVGGQWTATSRVCHCRVGLPSSLHWGQWSGNSHLRRIRSWENRINEIHFAIFVLSHF